MKIASHQERTIVLLLGGFVLGIIALFAMACGEPSTDVDDIEVEVDGVNQASWCFGFPYKVMNFPENQGAWRGSEAGQNSSPIFWNNHCPATGEEYAYVQNDGKINLLQNVGWAPSTCWTFKGSTGAGIVCNNQSFQCPAQACITTPSTWQLEAAPPLNAIIWGWTNPNESAAPGRHGIWPKVPTQCSNGVPTPGFTPNGSGGSTLTCDYPMGAYYLKQF